MKGGIAGCAAPVAIAVVSYNTRSLLRDCLESLQADADRGEAEVWVVDNASRDGSADLVREHFPWVRLIASERNLGYGRAVNAVAARTGSPWIAPANADIRVTPAALRALVSRGEHHPEAAIVAPRLILPDGSTQHSVYPFPTFTFTLAYVLGLTRRSRRLARHWCIDAGFDPEREREVAWAVGAFLLVRREAWEQIQGFDERQWMYAEDLDLGWQMSRRGWTTRYVPAAQVHHQESAATREAWGDDRHRRWHASSYAWMLRRRGPVVTRAVAAANVFGFGLQAAVRLLGVRRRGDGSRAAVRQALSASRSHLVGLRSGRYLSTVR